MPHGQMIQIIYGSLEEEDLTEFIFLIYGSLILLFMNGFGWLALILLIILQVMEPLVFLMQRIPRVADGAIQNGKKILATSGFLGDQTMAIIIPLMTFGDLILQHRSEEHTSELQSLRHLV